MTPFKSIYEEWLGKNKDKSFAQQISETGGGNDVSRSDVINVKEPPKKSEWFGYKYRVIPETSRLLQEAVLKDGGGWSGGKEVKYTDMEYIFVKDSGDMTFSNDERHFSTHVLLSKAPPQEKPPETKKEFKKNYWYKCISGTSGAGGITQGKYYLVTSVSGRLTVAGDNGVSNLFGLDRFDVNSESSFNPTALSDANNTCVGMVRQTNDLTKQTEEKQTMSNANRRVVNVKLLDNDSGLPVEYALVAQFQGIVTEDSDEVVKQEILLNKKIADAIAKHNEKRVEQTDLEILKRTGNDVKLRQVKLKDLTWIVSAA